MLLDKLFFLQKTNHHPSKKTGSISMKSLFIFFAIILFISIAILYISLNNKDVGEPRLIYSFIMIALPSSIMLSVYFYIRLEELKKENLQLYRTAYADDLTGLHNRRSILVYGEENLSYCSANCRHASVLFMDLDQFKSINDTYGHHQGDILLHSFARRLIKCVSHDGIVGCMSGDEFIIILLNVDREHTIEVVEKILHNLTIPFMVQDQKVFIKSSIGISRFPEDGHIIEELIHHADIAMYHAKNLKSLNYVFYQQSMDSIL